MPSNLQRLPAERVRHRKRLPFQGWPDAAPLARQNNPFTLTGPITVTQFIPIPNTNTVNTVTTTSSPALPTTTTSAIVTPTLPTDTAISSPSQPAPAPPIVSEASGNIKAPSPIASAINPGNSTGTEGALNGPVSTMSSNQHGLPTGAVVGITIACVMLILGALIFFIRQRALRNRELHRTTAPWISAPRPTDSSFEPRAVAPYSSAPSNNMGETSPGVSFARAQAAALATRAPVPNNMPQPLPASYNNPIPAAVPAGSGGEVATVLYEFVPSLPDELSITTGEVVNVVSEYDDGWALCSNARGDKGMVPLECLDRASSGERPQGVRRTSSLRM